ncbi:MAG: putative metallopeptidase [Saprospiraceae bacterium]
MRNIKDNVSLIFLVILAIIFSMCGKEEIELPVITVHNDFQPFLDQYIIEAQKRGIDADFTETGLSIKFSPDEDGPSAGVCFLGQFRIEIDRTDWSAMSPTEKEGLIFHELGHCHLARPHTNLVLPNGEWKSRMRGDPFTNETISTNINYSGRRRVYYTDELFNEDIPTPDWVSITQAYDFITDNDREVLYERKADTSEFKERQFLSTGANWEVELEMNNIKTDEFIALVWGQEGNNNSWRIGYNREKIFIITSGINIWGTVYANNAFEEINNDKYNKLTVRQIDNVIYVFFNEKFTYWFDYNEQPLGIVQSLERNADYKFRNIRISKLK